MHRLPAAFTGFLFLTTSALTVFAIEPDGVVVPGYQRFRGEHLSEAEAGRLLISELNCQSCHGKILSEVLPTRRAPILTEVGSRIQAQFLEGFIADPQRVKPGTAMPKLLSGPNAARQAEALAAFLTANGTVVPTPVTAASAKRGEQLFHAVGCAACHGDQHKPLVDRPNFVMPLGPIDQKYTVGSLTTFLKNPHAARPSGRMPSLNLNDEEARDIASYLLKDIEVEANIVVEVYRGDWDDLPDFDSLKPQSIEPAIDFTVDATAEKDRFGLRFKAWLNVPADGEYQFWLGSDDGSRLLIDDEEVIRIPGVHPHQTKDATVQLAAGPHPVVVEYFEKSGEESLAVQIAGPDLARQPLAGLVSQSPEGPSAPGVTQTDPGLVTEGRRLFTSLGCAACHQHDALKKAQQPPRQYPQFASMQPRGGCLGHPVAEGTPRFAVSPQQRDDMTAAIMESQSEAADASGPRLPALGIREVMLTLNCFACHERDKLGGVPRVHDHLFVGSIPEMGDEGRIPPHLNGVGDKLQETWMREILNSGAKDRPYMATRMPRFGNQNVGKLVNLFVDADQKTEVGEVEFSEPMHRVKSAARFLVGDQSLSCIKCHYFGKHRATGIQSLDMTKMTKRLRRDWFHRYLINPQQFRPGTRMPGSWPNGKSIVKKVLNGDTHQQIEAIWLYLSDGEKARLPSGLIAKAIELKPVDRPIIYRNFIEGLSPRGIAVGFPEMAHYAWDAEQMNVRLIWHHQFIDASKHWVGRGPGFQSPLGDHVMTLISGQPLAVLSSDNQKWPAEASRDAGFQFRGYHLNKKGQPAFRYDWQGLHVIDFIEPRPTENDAELVRTVTVQGTPATDGAVYFRVAAGRQIEQTRDGFLVDRAIEFIPQSGRPVVRTVDGRTELLVPVQIKTDKVTTIRYVMRW